MQSHVTRRYRALYAKLPAETRRDANAAYCMWKADPFHSSLQFKELEDMEGIWSVRIGFGWRALATKEGDEVTWFWIGSHANYDKWIREH